MEEVENKEETKVSLSTDFIDEFFKNSMNEDEEKPVGYTTELLENMKTLDPSLTTDQLKSLFSYLKGGPRPDFMDSMMTQTNEKLNETIKLMAINYLYKLPILMDYQKALQQNLVNPERIQNMSYDEIAKVSYNIQKEINDLLIFSLNVSKALSGVNTIPTKVEKLASALLNLPEATRDRIEELVKQES